MLGHLVRQEHRRRESEDAIVGQSLRPANSQRNISRRIAKYASGAANALRYAVWVATGGRAREIEGQKREGVFVADRFKHHSYQEAASALSNRRQYKNDGWARTPNVEWEH